MRFGRYRACRQGLTEEQVKKQQDRLRTHGYIRLRNTVFPSWKVMYDAVDKDAFRYNVEMLDWPALPAVRQERVLADEAMPPQDLYTILESAGLILGYEPNECII